MNVKELIKRLGEIKDQNQEVKIAVRQYNKIHPVAYLDPWDGFNQAWNELRIVVSLPPDMHTVKKGKK